MNASPPQAFETLSAAPGWSFVEFISDLHLTAPDATFEAWSRYLQATAADAVFILGDLFEAWIGDDAAQTPGFAATAGELLRQAADARHVYFMHGNRDFLVGGGFASSCGLNLLHDPTVFTFGSNRWLLTHGDALCVSDTDYLRFREQVRTPRWIGDFLARPLAEREATARAMRDQSRMHQDGQAMPADVDDEAARAWLRAAACDAMIHGHTHRPGEHVLGGGLRRIVLTDWDLQAEPPRAGILRIHRDGRTERLPLPH